MLRAGCASRHRRGVCARAGTQREAAARGADVRDDRGRALGPARLAGGAWGHARGDGEHGRVLEARVLRAGGGLHVSAGQRRSYQAGPGPEDRRQGLHVDRAMPGARTAAGQLRAAGGDSRDPRPDAASQGADPGADPGGQPRAQAPGRCRDQAGVGRHQHPRGVGRAMLEALVHGTTDAEVLADLARGKLRKKLPALRQALAGRFRPHHAFLVSQLLAHVDYLDEAIATVSEEVEGRLAPFAAQLTQLDTIPGINTRTAEVIIAELGVDMSFFPSARHLASWSGICPGNNESAGKHKSGKTRKGNRCLRMTLIEAAGAAIRTKDSALGARYRRVMRHRGHKKAVVAVAHAMLRTVYHLLAEGTTYREPGADYYDRHHPHRATRRAIQLLERQGHRVVLEPAA